MFLDILFVYNLFYIILKLIADTFNFAIFFIKKKFHPMWTIANGEYYYWVKLTSTFLTGSMDIINSRL